MVKFKDLTKILSLRSKQLSTAEKLLLTQRAARELAERSLLGAVVVPLCFAMAVFTSGYIFHSPYTCIFLSLVMLGSALARRLAISSIKKCGVESLPTWLKVYFGGCLGMAGVWGITTAIFIYTYSEGFPVLLILILSAGVGAASMVNFCIWRALAVTCLLDFGSELLVAFNLTHVCKVGRSVFLKCQPSYLNLPKKNYWLRKLLYASV